MSVKEMFEDGSVNLFSVFKKQINPLYLDNLYNIAAVSKAP
jgi:hypothetical protein